MILDTSLTLARSTTVPTPVATALVGDVIDLSLANQQVGGEGLSLVITVDTAILAAGAGTLAFALATDSVPGVSSSSQVLFRTGAFVTSSTVSIPAGSVVFVCELPAALLNSSGNDWRYKRYLGLLAIVGSNALTAGKVDAFLTNDPAAWLALPAAI